jgi:hypothetical protein
MLLTGRVNVNGSRFVRVLGSSNKMRFMRVKIEMILTLLYVFNTILKVGIHAFFREVFSKKKPPESEAFSCI